MIYIYIYVYKYSLIIGYPLLAIPYWLLCTLGIFGTSGIHFEYLLYVRRVGTSFLFCFELAIPWMSTNQA